MVNPLTSRPEQTGANDEGGSPPPEPGGGARVVGVGEGVAIAVTVTVAGTVVDNKTLSLVWLPLSIDNTCVLAKSNVMLGLVGAVAAVALSFRIAILVFVFTALAGSAPIDKEIFAVPTVLSY